jgi:hypothetical protein
MEAVMAGLLFCQSPEGSKVNQEETRATDVPNRLLLEYRSHALRLNH